MAERSYPFEDTDSFEAEWLRMARLWAPTHLVGDPSTGAYAATLDGLTVSVSCRTNGDPAEAWVDGSMHELRHDPDTLGRVAFAIPVNTDSTLARVDRIVLRRDPAANRVRLAHMVGTVAASPVAPELTQVPGGVYEVPLYRFTVPAGSGTTLSGLVDDRYFANPDTGWHGYKGAPSVDVQTFSVAGPFTWAKPAGAVTVDVTVIAGGGGGGSSAGGSATTRAGGGGGGGAGHYSFSAGQLGATVSGTVGRGGVGAGAYTSTNGGAGDATSFGPLSVGAGAGGGSANSSHGQGGLGGLPGGGGPGAGGAFGGGGGRSVTSSYGSGGTGGVGGGLAGSAAGSNGQAGAVIVSTLRIA